MSLKQDLHVLGAIVETPDFFKLPYQGRVVPIRHYLGLLNCGLVGVTGCSLPDLGECLFGLG